MIWWDEVVFVGGATITLWITDPAAPPPRPTKDVDVIVEVATRADYYAFEERLRAAGFTDDGNVICRWRHRGSGLILDAMPTDAALLGFENQWQRESFPHAVVVDLPSGTQIRAVPPQFLLATKIEAHLGRGAGDLLSSRDFADIVDRVLDGVQGQLLPDAASQARAEDVVIARLHQIVEATRA
jgi:predicted nucleotidyltransferase